MTERLPDRTARETECRPGILSDTVMRAVVVPEAGGVRANVSDGESGRVFGANAILNAEDELVRLVRESLAVQFRTNRA